ncbi:hypothetical protein D3C83_176380 [compost metagenome]
MQRGPMWAQAAALTQGVVVNGYEGTITFDLDYAALSAQIGMPVAAGTSIEIHGHWQNTGHQWGRNSAGRPGGAVRLP